MGTIAARDCLRVLELAESVAAIVLLGDCQAVDLRGVGSFSSRTRRLYEFIRQEIPMVERDRRQDLDIQHVLALHRKGKLPSIGRGIRLDPSANHRLRWEPRAE